MMNESDITWLPLLLLNTSCVGYMMTSGSFNFSSNSSSICVDKKNEMYPSWYVSCNSTNEYTELLSSLNFLSRQVFENQKDDFSNSNLIIAFIVSGVCVGSWMLFLLLFLLPSTNLNRQNKLVHMCILYFSIFHTITLVRTTYGVFEKQYENDYQSSIEFRDIILESSWFRWNSLICLMVCDILWIMLVYYMFSNSEEHNSGWFPSWLNSNNKKIIFVGLLVSTFHCIFAGLYTIPPSGYERSYFSIPYVLSEYCIYTVLFVSVVVYAYQLINSTITDNSTTSPSKLKICRIFLRQFNDTVSLMIYNLLTFLSLYLFTILETIEYDYCSNWMMMLVNFIKILVIVNTWGLIGVLEKRQRRLSKETILGRRVNGIDRLFSDPKIRSDDVITQSRYSNESLYASNDNLKNNKIFKPSNIIFKKILAFLRHPVENNTNSTNTEGYRLSQINLSDNIQGQDLHNVVSADETIETLLTRNVIYHYGNDE